MHGGMRVRSVRCRGGSEQQCEGSPEACLFSFHFANQEGSRRVHHDGLDCYTLLAATGVSGCNRRYVEVITNTRAAHKGAVGSHGSRDISYRTVL